MIPLISKGIKPYFSYNFTSKLDDPKHVYAFVNEIFLWFAFFFALKTSKHITVVIKMA